MCGSLDHLIRDCPVASKPHPMHLMGMSWHSAHILNILWNLSYQGLKLMCWLLYCQELRHIMHHLGLMSVLLPTFMVVPWLSIHQWCLMQILTGHLFMVDTLPQGKFGCLWFFDVECTDAFLVRETEWSFNMLRLLCQTLG